MFTETERIRAIELYFKSGRKLASVVRELGYPAKRNLRHWIRAVLQKPYAVNPVTLMRKSRLL